MSESAEAMRYYTVSVGLVINRVDPPSSDSFLATLSRKSP